MKKSFLELLEAERKAVFDAEFFRKSAVDFLNQSKEADSIEKRESCERIACEYEKTAVEAEENLLQIRKEMKQYISFLETL